MRGYVSIVFKDACNFLGAYIPKTVKIIARNVTQIPLLTFFTSLLLYML